MLAIPPTAYCVEAGESLRIMLKKVAAVVVTYNRKEMLLENIACLMAQTVRDEMEIIIVDNASTDGTKEALKEYEDSNQIIYLNTGENLGGAGGFQYGIRYAAERDYEFAWVMDDDSMPREDTLEQLLRYGEKLKGNYGFLSSKVIWTDGEINIMNIPKTRLTKKVDDFHSPQVQIISATFVSMLIPIKMVREVGLPIKEFFIWCDDVEFSRRISRHGHPGYLINTSEVVHKTKDNIGSNIALDDMERIGRFRYAYRNEMYVFKREGLKGWAYAFTRLGSHILRVICRAKDHKGYRIKVMLSAIWESFSFHPKIEYVEDLTER